MFYYIKGTLEECEKDFIIVDNNGFGMKIFVSASTLDGVPGIGRPVKLYTYFHVREDIMALYGFLSREELNMFELLISVSGVGPRAGLSILSLLSPAKLGLSIIGGDIKSLTAVPGIGTKTAHRIILELKDKIDKDGIMELDSMQIEDKDDHAREALHALMALGYSTNEANSAISKLDIEGNDTETVIKLALKKLMK